MDRDEWIDLVLEAVTAWQMNEFQPMEEIVDILVEYGKIERMIRDEALSHGHGASGVVEWLIKMEKAYEYTD